jgi:hypothetical protein
MPSIASRKTPRLGPVSIGQRYTRLVVVSAEKHNDQTLWRCRCDCGKEKLLRGSELRSAVIRSCGCWIRENAGKHTIRHGGFGTALYEIWKGMKRRCYNKLNKSYSRYGGRGITVCDRWLAAFENFREDMGERPTESHSIERVDNSLGYSKENCVWATPLEQARNRRTNVLLTIGDETKTQAEWARSSGITSATIRARRRAGLIGAALIAPRGSHV